MSISTGATPAPERLQSPFVPLLLVTLAWLGWTAFQTDLLVAEHQGLEQVHAFQQPQLEQARKLREAYQSLLMHTEVLAGQGDAGAKLVVDQLKSRGIALPPRPPTATPRR